LWKFQKKGNIIKQERDFSSDSSLSRKGGEQMQTRKRIALGLTVLMFLMTLSAISAQTEGIQIQDPALEQFIRREIGKAQGPILAADVAEIRTIDTTT
jgi:hypothetical protein